MRWWMLYGNVFRKGYGNVLIGRYGGCFEEGYNEVYDDRAYYVKSLDVSVNFVLIFKMRKGNVRYRRG